MAKAIYKGYRPVSHCRCCGEASAVKLFGADLLGRKVSYFDCSTCGYVQTEEPTWLGEAYASSINASDTGIIVRNLSNVSLVLATLTLMGRRHSQVVDYGGGYGFLVRLLRDIGVDALWADPYSENLVARGFEYQGGVVSLVTAFEAFEHFVSPPDEMEKLLGIAPNILLTTNIIADPAPEPGEWWYYGLDHGQHIGFYRKRTLQYLANRFGMNLLTDGKGTHLFSSKAYSTSAWLILKKTAQWAPRLLKLSLSSKTWTDHLIIAKKVGQ